MRTRDRHRIRVEQALEGYAARHAVQSWALSALHPHVTLSGAGRLSCSRCGAEGRAPLPGVAPAAFTEACELWLAKHRNCEAVE